MYIYFAIIFLLGIITLIIKREAEASMEQFGRNNNALVFFNLGTIKENFLFEPHFFSLIIFNLFVLLFAAPIPYAISIIITKYLIPSYWKFMNNSELGFSLWFLTTAMISLLSLTIIISIVELHNIDKQIKRQEQLLYEYALKNF